MEIINNKTIVIKNYNKIDGRNAYESKISDITIGKPVLEENKSMDIALQIWNLDKQLKIELSIHQVFDVMIFISKTLDYFQEAYRLPLLYNPDNPILTRIPLQGDFVDMEIAITNSNINNDIQDFMDALAHMGDMNHERLTMIKNILDDLGYF